MQCPKCGSGDLKKLELIIQEGTNTAESESKGTTRGAAGGAQLYASTSATTSTTVVSELAKKVSPPEKQSPVGTILLGLVVGPIVGIVLVMIVGNVLGLGETAGGIILIVAPVAIIIMFIRKAIQISRYNKTQWPGLYEAWKRSFHCGRCGEIFEGDLGT